MAENPDGDRRRRTKRVRSRGEPKRSRPRRSKFARWVVRPLVWSPALLALLVVAVLVLLESDRFAIWATSLAEQQAGKYLNRRVEIGDLSIDLIPLSVEAKDLVIAGSAAGLPFAEVARVQVEAQVGSLINPGITLHSLFVERPLIRVGFDETGRHDAPRTRRRDRNRPRRLEVEIGDVQVVGGVFEMEHRKYPLEASAQDFKANLGGGDLAGGLEIAGQVRADDVTIVLPQARPYLGAVALRGSYRRGSIEIASGSFDAPDVSAKLSGSVHWRDASRADFSISASGRGRLLDRLGYGDGLIRGPFDFSGGFTREEQDWALDGELSSTRVDVVDRSLQSVGGQLRVDRSGANYRIENSRYGNGFVTGSVRMAMGSGDAPVELDLQLKAVDVGFLLEDQNIPISGLAATANGTFAYQFARSRPRSGNGWADLQIERDERPDRSGLPVQGSAVLSIGDGRLRTEAVRLTNESQLLVATGAYDMNSNRGTFGVEVSTQRVQDVLALLPIEDRSALWVPNQGRGEISAEVVLDRNAVSVATELNLTDVAAPGFEANRVQGTFGFDGAGLEGLRLELLRPAAAMIVTGSVPFVDEGSLEPGRELSLALDSEGWPLAEFGPWLPFEMQLLGLFSGGALIEGTLESPRGSVRGQVGAPSLGDLTASRLNFDLAFSPEQVLFHEAELGFGQEAIRVRGAYEVPSDRLALVIDSDRLDLGELGALPIPAHRMAGTLEISGTLGGSRAKPEASLALELASASIDGRVLGNDGSGTVSFEWSEREITTAGGIDGLFRLAGGGAAEDGVVDLEFDVSSPDVRSVLSLFSEEPLPSFEAEAAGRLRVAGEIDVSEMPAAQLRLDELRVRHAGQRAFRSLENLEPVSIAVSSERIDVASFYLATPDGTSDVFISGRIGLDAEKTLDLNVQSSLGATWFEPWMSTLR